MEKSPYSSPLVAGSCSLHEQARCPYYEIVSGFLQNELEFSNNKHTYFFDRLEALAQANADLVQKNQELEQLAYYIAHDLQEPLRTINNLVKLLAEEDLERSNERTQQYLALLQNNTKWMQQSIGDLLSYARLSNKEQRWLPVELGEVVEQTKKDLDLLIRENNAIVNISELPIVKGQLGEITQLFYNLIGNAIKFKGSQPPKVDIGAKRNGAEWLIWVRDNGVGIKPEDAERVFQLFQRLQNRSECPGTGIGLAICRKIVDRYGGRIWVESELGKGSTFYFTLPVEKAKAKNSTAKAFVGNRE